MKILLDDFCDGGGGCIGPVVPSPIPPWKRAVSSPRTNTISSAGTIDLNYDTTYFDTQTSNNDGGTPSKNIAWGIVLPAGNYKRQIIRLYIPGKNISTSPATFSVTCAPGVGAGFTTLLFNNIGTSAVLEWDGSAWQLIGGNATPS